MFRFLQPCKIYAKQITMRGVGHISAVEFKADPKKFEVVMDVREPHETAEGHIAGAILEPLSRMKDDISAGALDALKQKRVVVYCRSGKRSMVGAELLEGAGFKNVTSMDGGWLEYSKL